MIQALARQNDFFLRSREILGYKATAMPSKLCIALCMEYPVAHVGGGELLVVELVPDARSTGSPGASAMAVRFPDSCA
jgi:hypothetical protein